MKIKTLKSIILGGAIVPAGTTLVVEVDVTKVLADNLLSYGDMVEEVKAVAPQPEISFIPQVEIKTVPQPEVILAPAPDEVKILAKTIKNKPKE